MRRALLLALLPAWWLGGCATAPKSTLGVASGPSNYLGTAPATLLASEADDEASRLQAELGRQLSGPNPGVPVQVGRTGEGFVRVRMGADESFENGTATLTPRGLLVLSEVAQVLTGAPASVIHVLAQGDDPGSAPATSLSARRAASVQSTLLARGLPATRVRAEGRGAREPASSNPADPANWRVDLVIRPVIAGSEPEAWMPPRTESPCAECSPKP